MGEKQNIIQNIESDCLNGDFLIFLIPDWMYLIETCREKAMREASAKRRLKRNHFSNKLPDLNKDVICNPQNPVNPDSKPS